MRALKFLVGVMGVMIVAGTVALVVLLVQRMNRAATSLNEAPALALSTDLVLRQPEGSRIAQIATAEGRLAVWVQRPDGDRILLIDPRAARQVGEIRLGQ